MRRRAFSIALLIFQAFWLNVVLPGHTRGVILIPDPAGAPPCRAQHACCPDRRSDCPSKTPASHCAICHFAARLTTPLVVDFTPPRLGLALVLDPPAPTAAASVRVPLALRDRAPPSCA